MLRRGSKHLVTELMQAWIMRRLVMCREPNISTMASLIADPARAAMLTALLDGRALPAGELAYASGVTAQTASSHLSKLLAGGLLSVEIEGRHRYYRLVGPHVAEALECLAAIHGSQPLRRKALTGGAEAEICPRLL
jgi:DNA-binding transcriptional ArsR family regulator